MNRADCENWIINIESCMEHITRELGYETVRHILSKYGARSVEELHPNQFSEIFSELYAIEADLK